VLAEDARQRRKAGASFAALTRVFSEHCEVTATEIAVLLPKPKMRTARARG